MPNLYNSNDEYVGFFVPELGTRWEVNFSEGPFQGSLLFEDKNKLEEFFTLHSFTIQCSIVWNQLNGVCWESQCKHFEILETSLNDQKEQYTLIQRSGNSIKIHWVVRTFKEAKEIAKNIKRS